MNTLNNERRLKNLEKARSSLSKIGISPNERQLQKIKIALQWTHAWGHSTSEILCKVVGSTSPSFLADMVKKTLLRKEKVCNRSFYLLTAPGLTMLKFLFPDLVEKLPLRRHVRMHQFHHDGFAQQILARDIEKHRDVVKSWRSERQIRGHNGAGKKVPDAELVLEDKVIYYEIETEKKYDHELHCMLYNLLGLARNMSDATYCQIYMKASMMPHYQAKLNEWIQHRGFHTWHKYPGEKKHREAMWGELDEVEILILQSLIAVMPLPNDLKGF
jgi:hypothetical protein